RTVRIVAVFRVERVQSGIQPLRPRPVSNGGSNASHSIRWISWMSIPEDNAVGGRQSGEIIFALDELVGSLTVRWAVFRNRLIKTHRRSAAAATQEEHFGDSRLSPEEIDPRPDIESYSLPFHQGLIVVEARVHAKDHESPP